MPGKDMLKGTYEKIVGLDRNQKILFLFMVTIIAYGIGILIDTFYLSSVLFPDLTHVDVHVYRDRAQTIIDGGMLYKDVHTETPVLVNYLLVPGQLLGGADQVWAAYFSFFAFMLSVMMYLAFRRADEKKAFLLALIVLLCPFLLGDTVIVEDEAIMDLVFMLAAVMMFYDWKKRSALAIALGIWTKMFSILLLPVEFLRQRLLMDRAILILIVIMVTALVTLPFYLADAKDFLFFLNFYSLGDASRPTGGQGIWHFLKMGGLLLPRMMYLAFVLGSLAITYLYAHWKKWGVWESMTVAVLVFFIFYPKVHTGYYTVLFALLAVWAVDDRRVLIRIVLAWVPMILSSIFAQFEAGEYLFGEIENGWVFGLFLSLSVTILFIDATRLALKNKPFIYRALPSLGTSKQEQRTEKK